MAAPVVEAAPVLLLAGSLLAASATPAAAQRWTLEADKQARIDEVFSSVSRDAPGCALGVVQDGQLAYARGYGLANLDWGIPISSSTVFDIGSVSKQFTAAALALLDLDGVLSLDDEVRVWVPELPDYGEPLTIRHLLNHTSGMRDYLTLMRLSGMDFANVFSEFDGVEMIVRQQALNFDPGAEYLYSNSGYLLLANIVRRASGQSLRDFLQARIFDPLGMAHTSIWDDSGEVLHERATGYGYADDTWRIDHAWNFQMGGDGQVITSVEDLARWDANFYDPVVGGAGLLEHLHTRGVLDSGDTISYALGLTVGEQRGLRRVAHGGSWAGFRAQMTRYPDERTSVIVLCNRFDAGAGGRANQVAEIVLADRFAEPEEARGGAQPSPQPSAEAAPAPALAPAELEEYSGEFFSDELAIGYGLEVVDGALHAELPGGERFALSPYDVDVFAGPGSIRFHFRRDAGGVTGFTVDAGRVRGIGFARR